MLLSYTTIMIRPRGFTIVELVIVIAVIGILASISVVAYNGTQARAEYAAAQTDIKHINDAILIYRSQNGQYPTTANAWVYQHATAGGAVNASFIPELVTGKYLDKMPVGKTKSGYGAYSYIYRSTGTEYKLLRYITSPSNLPSAERTDNTLLDPVRPATGWGYWSTGGASW